jgi:hypothetical protein
VASKFAFLVTKRTLILAIIVGVALVAGVVHFHPLSSWEEL